MRVCTYIYVQNLLIYMNVMVGRFSAFTLRGYSDKPALIRLMVRIKEQCSMVLIENMIRILEPSLSQVVSTWPEVYDV